MERVMGFEPTTFCLGTRSTCPYRCLRISLPVVCPPKIAFRGLKVLGLIASRLTAEAAVQQVACAYAEQLSAVPDAYLAARTEDVREVDQRIAALGPRCTI
jgi:hypothetical protein